MPSPLAAIAAPCFGEEGPFASARVARLGHPSLPHPPLQPSTHAYSTMYMGCDATLP